MRQIGRRVPLKTKSPEMDCRHRFQIDDSKTSPVSRSHHRHNQVQKIEDHAVFFRFVVTGHSKTIWRCSFSIEEVEDPHPAQNDTATFVRTDKS